jgi:hypothetical protein
MKQSEGIREVWSALLTPLPGAALATHYTGKRGRGLCAVRREFLTVSERGRHVARLRKAGDHPQAGALEQETLGLILSGALRLTAKEERDH